MFAQVGDMVPLFDEVLIITEGLPTTLGPSLAYRELQYAPEAKPLRQKAL
jgi:hypothetical protein